MSDVVIVARTADIGLATIWRDLLRDAGIQAEVADSGSSSTYPGMAQMAAFGVIVRSGDAERAHAIIEAAERETPDEPWNGNGAGDGSGQA